MTKRMKAKEMETAGNAVASELCEICARKDDRTTIDVLDGDNRLRTVIKTCRGSKECPGFKPGNIKVGE